MQFAPLRLLLWQYFGGPLRLRPIDAAEAIRAMDRAKSFRDLIAWTSRNQASGLDQIDAPVSLPGASDMSRCRTTRSWSPV
jgi:hypothetical protein